MAIQLISIAGAAILLVVLLALVLRRGRSSAPSAIVDPYEELYSEIRGEVIARPLGEPHAGVAREDLHRRDEPSQADVDTVEFVPSDVSRSE